MRPFPFALYNYFAINALRNNYLAANLLDNIKFSSSGHADKRTAVRYYQVRHLVVLIIYAHLAVDVQAHLRKNPLWLYYT